MLSIIIIINLVQKPVARMRRAGDSPGGRGAKRNQRKSRDVSRVERAISNKKNYDKIVPAPPAGPTGDQQAGPVSALFFLNYTLVGF